MLRYSQHKAAGDKTRSPRKRLASIGLRGARDGCNVIAMLRDIACIYSATQ
jgi:uncharacterized protein (DUF1501 family)